MTTSNGNTIIMKLSMGEAENWDSDGHNFLAKAASKWNATDHNGMSIIQYLLRTDPSGSDRDLGEAGDARH